MDGEYEPTVLEARDDGANESALVGQGQYGFNSGDAADASQSDESRL